MKVLILCNDFPPINSIGSERPYSWYYYFRELGVEPVVITKNWKSDGNSRFTEIKKERVVETTDKGTIIRVPETVTPSVWFKNKFGERFSLFRRALTLFDKILSFPFSPFDQHSRIYKEALSYLKVNKMDVIITSGEPFILFKYGYLLRSRFKVKWLADYRDGWYLNHVRSLMNDPINRFIRWYELKFELLYSRRADFITTVDPHLAERLQKLLNKKTDVIYNGFWDFHESDTDSGKNKKLILNHTGTLTIGQRVEFLLDVLVEMLENGSLKEDQIEVNFIGLDYFPEQAKRVKNYHVKLNNIVKTTPRLPKMEAIKMNLQADFLLNFTDPNLSAIYAKTYEYIACKKTILVVPGDEGLLDELIRSNGLGEVFSEKEKLIRFIEQELNKDKIQTIKKIDWNKLLKFQRKEQCKNLVDLIKLDH